MADIIWNQFLDTEKDEYKKFLKIFGALSALFKDTTEGTNAQKPYLYYRNHEQLFARVFSVEDLTRKDGAFDMLLDKGSERIGIGLKTWIHSNDITFQKVAEFNKASNLIKYGDPENVIRQVAELRNERLLLDKRLHNTNKDVYHFITRDDGVMNIVEGEYRLIDLDSIELTKYSDKSYEFKDQYHNYRFNKSKSTLFKKFDASETEVIEKISIEQLNDPFELLEKLHVDGMSLQQSLDLLKQKESSTKKSKESIYLPLYQDKKEGRIVTASSGVNMRHGKPKAIGSNTPRPEFEIEVRISTWIHRVFPGFFGIDAFNPEEIATSNFNLILPDGRKLAGRIKQDNGKSLQTNPQGALGEWILKDVLGLENREVVTMELLEKLGIDSLKITKVDDNNFKITVAETFAYEKFKLDNQQKLLSMGLKGRQIPFFRPELFESEELN
ncbi:hypothetical protein [Cetobacterium sp.]|uniref:hypothetical protein n=1 Tax=Cetobacterium sp. TaxID=2071632 RepID=UPI003F3D7FAB